MQAKFQSNIEFILRFVYKLLPEQMTENAEHQKDFQKAKMHYDQLLAASKNMCAEFTGPHCVLQIFLGKLVYCINDYSEHLKHYMKQMNLWIEYKKF